MGKNSKKRKRAAVAAQREQHIKHASKPSKPSDKSGDDEEVIHGISPEELLITVETLQALSNYCRKPCGVDSSNDAYIADAAACATKGDASDRADLLTTLSQKRYKELRTALHPFVVALKAKYEPSGTSSYQSHVTVALQSRRWTDAYIALKGCLDLEVAETGSVRRGTVQRWVRLCDDCPHPNLRFKILRAVLACCPQDDGGTGCSADDANKAGEGSTYDGLNKHDPRRVLAENEMSVLVGTKFHDSNDSSDDEDGTDGIKDKDVDGREMKITKSTLWVVPSGEVSEDATSTNGVNDIETDLNNALSHLDNVEVQTIHHVPAAERKPANHHDLRIYATPPNTIRIIPPAKPTKRHDIHLIPSEKYGAFVLTNVLSAAECQQLLHVAETKMKYIPDHPTTSPESTGIDTCEWLVDSTILDPIHQRIMPFINQTVHGERVAGVNARWRLFRYGEHRTYRPHIDGSWPGSGQDKKTGMYTSDAFNGDRRSRYTFLIYLNEGFDGGGTTFYLPAANIDDGFETVSVKPSRGSVLLFPQGNTASLLHEGSKVTGGGFKYVVRTDLLYHLKNEE